VAIYRRYNSRLAGLVVGPAGPIGWSNGLFSLRYFLCFMVKHVKCSFSWIWILDGVERRRVEIEVEWRWK